MPYILKKDREKFVEALNLIEHNQEFKSAGELNYLITEICLIYQRQKSKANQALSYQTINDVIGVLSASSQEYYRRVAAGFEDGKVISNGDVY